MSQSSSKVSPMPTQPEEDKENVPNAANRPPFTLSVSSMCSEPAKTPEKTPVLDGDTTQQDARGTRDPPLKSLEPNAQGSIRPAPRPLPGFGLQEAAASPLMRVRSSPLLSNATTPADEQANQRTVHCKSAPCAIPVKGERLFPLPLPALGTTLRAHTGIQTDLPSIDSEQVQELNTTTQMLQEELREKSDQLENARLVSAKLHAELGEVAKERAREQEVGRNELQKLKAESLEDAVKRAELEEALVKAREEKRAFVEEMGALKMKVEQDRGGEEECAESEGSSGA